MTVRHCTAEEGLSAMADEAIVLTITSPPYNHNVESGRSHIVQPLVYGGVRDGKPEPEYQAEQIAVLDLLYEKTAPGGSCFYNHKQRWRREMGGATLFPLTWLAKTRWQIRQEIIWDHCATQAVRGWRFFHTHESIFWLHKPAGKAREIDRRVAALGSVWRIPRRVEKNHPCAFPMEIPRRLIMAATAEGDLVCDPYAGTGTTLQAAKWLGREHIGFDSAAEYVKLANDRLAGILVAE